MYQQELKRLKVTIGLLASDLAAAREERDRLREALRYVLDVWEGSMKARPEQLEEWISKAKAALKEGK